LNVSFDPGYRQDLVENAIRTALGEEGFGEEGLFSFRQRDFGQPEYATRVSGVVQNVPGVLWNQVTGLHLLGETDDPVELAGRPNGLNRRRLPCDSLHLLSLYTGSLLLSAVATPEEAC
jgi:hypothetical protein